MKLLHKWAAIICCAWMATNAAQAPGTWRDVTPVPYMPSAGAEAILLDPARPSDIYVNFDNQGIWRSTDYGSTWTKANTGTNGDKMNSGRAWYAAIGSAPGRDPATSPTLYFTLGWGSGLVWKSTDFGVNWTNVWNNNIYLPDGTNISADVGGDIHSVHNADVSDPNHVIVSLHSYGGSGGNNGVFETTNGGTTWIVHRATFNFQVHSDIMFPVNRTTWMVGHYTSWPSGELWRTNNSSASWSKVMDVSDGAGGRNSCRAGSTVFISGKPFRSSTDGGATWKSYTNGGTVGSDDGVFASATTLYTGASPAGGVHDPASKLYSTPLANVGSVWTEIPLPAAMHVNKPDGGMNTGNFYMGSSIISGGVATFDGTNTILVTSNFSAGIWRYVEPVSATTSLKALKIRTHVGNTASHVSIVRNAARIGNNGAMFDIRGKLIGKKGVIR